MNHQSLQKKIFGLSGWLVLCFIAAAIGAIASVDAKAYYAQLHQPDWAPPGWIFGPVWSVLYTLMGYTAWRIWCVNTKLATQALIIFVVQLVANALWSWLFFHFHLGLLSFIEILLLLILIVIVVFQFWRIERVAGALLLPYLAWVSFAALLNYAMWQLNPQFLS